MTSHNQMRTPWGPIATAPGTLRAQPGAHETSLSAVVWDAESLEEFESPSLEQITRLHGDGRMVWVSVVGLKDVETLATLGREYGLHTLALEDTLNVPQRAKLDDYDSHVYLVAQSQTSDSAVVPEQISVFFGPGFVVSVEERPGGTLDGIRERLRNGRPRLRGGGADYVAYTILDALVDGYFPVIHTIADRIDEFELAVLAQSRDAKLSDLHDLKRDLIALRRYLEPLRSMLAELVTDDNQVFAPETKLFLRDCQDHCRQAFDLVESHRSTASSVMDLQLSISGQRMNEVMKVLTVIATLFIPLSFIAGVYGMNFERSISRWNMPELGWAMGYPFALGLMFACAFAMLYFFWRKGWFR